MTMTMREAATARATGVRRQNDRPSQRRCMEEAGSPALVRAQLAGVEIRAAGDSKTAGFSGYATITDTPYEMYDMFGPYTEIIGSSAVALALATDPDVNFVLNHGGVPFGRTKSGTMTLAAEEVPDGDHTGKIGLKVDVPSMDMRMPSVQDVVVALERGDLDEMSFKFRITAGAWSPDYTVYTITQFDIDRGDVSVVNYGANPFTSAKLLAAVDPKQMSLEDLRACVAELSQRDAAPVAAGSLSAAQADAIASE